MNDDFKKIRRLIKKYGLVKSSYYDGTHPQSQYRDERYGFEGDCNFVSGHVIGIDNTDKKIWFGNKCQFMKDYAEIVYESWERHDSKYYERYLKKLRIQYDMAMLSYKKYWEKRKLEDIEADFA